MEFGANIGNNLIAIKSLLPSAKITGVEINAKAVAQMSKIKDVTAIHGSILEFSSEQTYDFVFTKGVLIHINLEELDNVYTKMYEASSKYIYVAEYYNPAPVTINYRGHDNRLFKRDFAGEILDKYSNLKLVDYGFAYHRDNNFPLDDISWFLLKKIKKEA